MEPLRALRAVVTGSTRGLGFAFAAELAARGAAVVVTGTTADGVDAAVARLARDGGRAVGVVGSVESAPFCDELIATCVREFGGVDLLVNNAGITADRSLLNMTADEFDRVVAVNLRGTWAAGAAAARAMTTSGGAILNITSGSGLFGMFGQSNYAAAKAGVIGLTRVMHLELQRYGIRVNALAPVASTDMTRRLGTDGEVAHAEEFPPPETVAPIVAFLAGPRAVGVAGQVLSFDGTELSVWSHPAPTSTTALASWRDDDFAAALAPGRMERIHPDRWGRGVRR